MSQFSAPPTLGNDLWRLGLTVRHLPSSIEDCKIGRTLIYGGGVDVGASLNRCLAAAEHIVRNDRDSSVLIITDTANIDATGLRQIDIVRLPYPRPAGQASAWMVADSERLKMMRSQIIAALIDAFKPQWLLVDGDSNGREGDLTTAIGTLEAGGVSRGAVCQSAAH